MFLTHYSFRGLALVMLGTGQLLPAQSSAPVGDPPAVYLTWQRDPTTTMTVQWHTTNETALRLEYRGTNEPWRIVAGTHHPLPQTDRTVHFAEITGLTPRTDYEFRFADGGPVFRFRTMPKDLEKPVRFVTGGDVFHERDWLDRMNTQAARLDPAFVLWGGDIAYSCGGTNRGENMSRWLELLDAWKQTRAPDGRLIPLLATIGNHEVVGSYNRSPARAKGFYSVFATPGERGYASLDFGRYLSVFLLDSAHTHPIAGEQTEWLRSNLAARRRFTHLFAIYHVPAYPSFRRETDGENARIVPALRTNWVPLFERYGVRVVFENHDHTFKRTHPLLKGKVDPRGVVYLGDGCWGVDRRKPDPDRWYLARTSSVRHCWLVTLYRDARHILAINEDGEVFDELFQRARN